MVTTTNTAMPPPESPVLTLPAAASKIGVTLWELVGLLNRPPLASLVARTGGRRMVMTADLPAFREAVAARPTTA